MDDAKTDQPYLVLARKYRPRNFAELIGQDAMVRTLTNAINADRLPHAFILTGVRGIGKTSTARIIARALNCIGADGTGGPTPAPCGVCEHCVAIAADRHVDVIEMDAASRTGVNDIRELIDGVRYRPVNALYKIYIIDEVHMLSASAFNALLKTLEEPPAHVKFIFATTETRKVPVTVLSRCQRFDLRRCDVDVLVAHFADIVKREGGEISDGALGLIARAADGSVRDGLSLLDQAMAHAGGIGTGDGVTEDAVREMLGLADGGRIHDLFELLMKGDIAEALDVFTELYNAGADPAVVLQDLLELTHRVTRIRIAPESAEGHGISQLERERGAAIATSLSLPALGRCWQILLKGLGEVRLSSSAAQAAEMVLIRLAYVSDLPSPADLIRRLTDKSNAAGPDAAAAPTPTPSDAAPVTSSAPPPRMPVAAVSGGATHFEAQPDSTPIQQTEAASQSGPVLLNSFEEMVALFEERREGILHSLLLKHVRLVSFEPGHLSFSADDNAPADLANRISRHLRDWTGEQWLVSLSDAPGAPTLREQREGAEKERHGRAVSDPLVQAALAAFPGATVEAVIDRPTDEFGDPDAPDDIDEEEED
jgi:DNA polymerase-3 subunit gamma/tau